ncbi:MAG: tyrosine-type recombinase/integrase [Hyphomicrobium sp.]
MSGDWCTSSGRPILGSKPPFTDLTIRNLKARGGTRVEAWDDKIAGLGIRVSPTGTKSFVLLYRLNGRQKRMTLGRYPLLCLSDARKRATEVLCKLSQGADPQAEKAEARTYPRFDETLDDFVRLYCNRHNRERTARETERLLRARVLKSWAAEDIRRIGKHHVLTLVDGIMDEGKPGAANHTFAAIRKLFSWCVQRGIVDVNPCSGIGAPSATVERERVLTDDELVGVWRAAGSMGYPYASLVRLLILTAQRRSEVTGLRWSEVDVGREVWSMPAERTKNARPHQIPLLPMATAIITDLPRLNETLAFPARGNDTQTFSGFSKLKRQLDELSGVTGWTLHDLRRTTATKLAGLGVAPHVIEKLLNHSTGVLGGVAGIYNRFHYLPEMRHALALWEAYLNRLTSERAPSELIPRSATSRYDRLPLEGEDHA